jgi:hypothetical protein
MVKGPEKDLAAFVQRTAGSNAQGKPIPLSFDALVPLPATQKANWYDWQTKNWGTKWDLDEETVVTKGHGHITYEFNSAWAPPDAWLIKVAKLFSTLRFTLMYAEPGMQFAGQAIYEGGRQTLDEDWSGDIINQLTAHDWFDVVDYFEEGEEFEDEAEPEVPVNSDPAKPAITGYDFHFDKPKDS